MTGSSSCRSSRGRRADRAQGILIKVAGARCTLTAPDGTAAGGFRCIHVGTRTRAGRGTRPWCEGSGRRRCGGRYAWAVAAHACRSSQENSARTAQIGARGAAGLGRRSGPHAHPSARLLVPLTALTHRGCSAVTRLTPTTISGTPQTVPYIAVVIGVGARPSGVQLCGDQPCSGHRRDIDEPSWPWPRGRRRPRVRSGEEHRCRSAPYPDSGTVCWTSSAPMPP